MNHCSTVVVKTLAERLERSTVAAFRREMQELLRMDQPRIVFNFCSVTRLDSGGIEFLLDCLTAVVRRDGELKLAALSPQAETILQITRVGRVFEIFGTAEEAVRSFDFFLLNANNFAEPWDLFRATSGNPETVEKLAGMSAAADENRKAARRGAAA
jgi:anti-sigma B factor antagonist